MKAAVYYETGPPEVLRYEDVPDPEVYEGGVVIDVEADQHRGWRHAEPRRRRDGRRFPTSSATSARGRSARSARGSPTVTSVSASSRPTCGVRTPSSRRSPRCSRGRCPTAPTSRRSRAFPSRSAPPTTACSSSAGCRPGETVLIQAGAGGVGIAAIQLAKRAGATVHRHRVERGPPRRALRISASTTASTTRATTGSTGCATSPGAGASTSSSTRSAARILAGSVQCLAYRGRCITVGSAGRDPQPFDAGMLVDGQPVAHRCVPRRRDRDPRAQAMIGRLIDDVAAGRLHVEIDRTYPLAEAAAAHAYLESRQAVGRVLLIP